jgi:hypothetical protein
MWLLPVLFLESVIRPTNVSDEQIDRLSFARPTWFPRKVVPTWHGNGDPVVTWPIKKAALKKKIGP